MQTAERIMGASMPARMRNFEPEKAIAALGYLAEKTGETLYPLMKLMYLADRMHLCRYGRLIAGDTYSAMSHGPVPSITYDLVKHVRGDKKKVPGTDLAERTFRYLADYRVVVTESPNYDELSESDQECLDEVLELLQKHGVKHIVNMSHDRAWQQCRERIASAQLTCDMLLADIAAFADNPALIEHLADPTPGEA